MKKCEFYTMKRINRETVAVLVKGYTDGTYNYYRQENTWYIIDPNTGRLLYMANTLSKTRELAKDINTANSVKYMKTTKEYEKWVKQFKEAVQTAREETNEQ